MQNEDEIISLTDSSNNDVIIQMMEIANSALNSIPESQQNAEYREICIKIQTFIDKHCEHHIVFDLIDINPDVSKTIQYCVKCNKTYE